jgi:hypothetical protein
MHTGGGELFRHTLAARIERGYIQTGTVDCCTVDEVHHRWTITGIKSKLIWKTRTTFGQVRSHKTADLARLVSARLSTRGLGGFRQQNLKQGQRQKTKKRETRTGETEALPSHDEHTRRLTNWNKQQRLRWELSAHGLLSGRLMTATT